VKISFIGAGNAAWNLAISLHSKGHEIIWISNRTLENAEILAAKVGAQATQSIQDLDWRETELILISTRDDGYEQVAQVLRTNIPVAHTSGSIPINILKDCSAQFGVFYPLQSMLKDRPTDFSKVPFCLEASSEELFPTLWNLAKDLSEVVYKINSEERLKLHLGAIFASNFSNFLYILSKDFLRMNQLPEHILDPLILETAQRIENMDPAKMQTGPARRGDLVVLNKHISMLEKNHLMRDVYRLMSQKIVEHYGHNSTTFEKF
jgi:predicted short-subunit dehydrogenase-like oxidoreductase (DUF2520 family)